MDRHRNILIVRNKEAYFITLDSNQAHMNPTPPLDGCPGGTVGCQDGRCPYTCLCEDHCSWEKCTLENAPDDCLSHVNSKWVWDSRHLFWVAKINGII